VLVATPKETGHEWWLNGDFVKQGAPRLLVTVVLVWIGAYHWTLSRKCCLRGASNSKMGDQRIVAFITLDHTGGKNDASTSNSIG
jgi:hypothetical protein